MLGEGWSSRGEYVISVASNRAHATRLRNIVPVQEVIGKVLHLPMEVGSLCGQYCLRNRLSMRLSHRDVGRREI